MNGVLGLFAAVWISAAIIYAKRKVTFITALLQWLTLGVINVGLIWLMTFLLKAVN